MRKFILFVASFLVGFSACQHKQQTHTENSFPHSSDSIMSKKIILTTDAPAPIGPYSQAVLAGNTLYVSGQIALNPNTGDLVNANIEQETAQVMNNLKAIVETAGFKMSDIVKCTIFLSDMNSFQAVNTVYGTYFTENPPARETVEVAKLPKSVNVEISAIAVK
jgi:2-iminobutanoate/2-iminopropanoate deaminase